MSIRIMSAVYDCDLEDIYDVSVLLALANHADDEGVCYPSIARICRLSRCKERKAQSVIKDLESRGYLSIEKQAGPRGTNLFRITLPPHGVHPARHAPPHDTTLPPHESAKTPARCAPETSRTIKKRHSPQTPKGAGKGNGFVMSEEEIRLEQKMLEKYK